MRRVPIRMKLAGALAVPLLALVVVTSLEVASAEQATDVHAEAALARLGLGPTGVLSASSGNATRRASTCSGRRTSSSSSSRTRSRRPG